MQTEHYVVITTDGHMAKTGSSSEHMMLTKKLEEALIWGSSSFASLFAAMHAGSRVKLVDVTMLQEALAENPCNQWYLGFCEEGETEYTSVTYFPLAAEQVARPMYTDYADVLMAKQIMSRKYGAEYSFAVSANPFRLAGRQRRRA